MIKKQNYDGSSNPSRRDMIKTIGLGMGFGVFTSPFSLCKKIDKGEVTTNQLSDPIYYSSATAIAQAIKTKTISSKEITQIFLNRISEVNQKN